ncbi:hypothetical protein N9T95_00495 [bacterium]|nr:hypothetical protein [bacterium]
MSAGSAVSTTGNSTLRPYDVLEQHLTWQNSWTAVEGGLLEYVWVLQAAATVTMLGSYCQLAGGPSAYVYIY